MCALILYFKITGAYKVTAPPENPEYRFRRNHERRRYYTEVVFSHKKRAYAGNLDNISLGGAYIVSHSVNQFSSGDIVTMSIPFATGKKILNRRGRVKWLNNEGFAIEFLS